MATYAVIENATNVCDNVVVWDDEFGPWIPPIDHYIVNIDGLSVGIGWFYNPDTKQWIPPSSNEGQN